MLPLVENIRNTEIHYGDNQPKLFCSQQLAQVAIRECKIIKDINVTPFNKKRFNNVIRPTVGKLLLESLTFTLPKWVFKR